MMRPQSHKTEVTAQIGISLFAAITVPTGQRWFDSDALSNFQQLVLPIVSFLAHSGNGSCKLMSQD
jgi:hypothetical protein